MTQNENEMEPTTRVVRINADTLMIELPTSNRVVALSTTDARELMDQLAAHLPTRDQILAALA